MSKITIHHPSIYRVDYLVDGEVVGSVNQVTHAWNGMGAATDIVKALAAKLNIEITETFNEEYW
jgi:hypothetical protein